jgi:dolichyl-phosphate-mannose--protein O-mannosyl transferase
MQIVIQWFGRFGVSLVLVMAVAAVAAAAWYVSQISERFIRSKPLSRIIGVVTFLVLLVIFVAAYRSVQQSSCFSSLFERCAENESPTND